jgi:hypothetical protein
MISGGPAAASASRERGRATRLDRLCYKRWAAPLRPLASAHHSTCRPPVTLHPLSAYATFGRRRCYRRRRRLLRPAGGAATFGRRCRRKRRGRLLRPAGSAAANSGGACFVRPAALLPNAGGSAASGDACYIRPYQRPAALLQAAAAPATSGDGDRYFRPSVVLPSWSTLARFLTGAGRHVRCYLGWPELLPWGFAAYE